MKKCFLILICTALTVKGFCWGFYGHRLINFRAVFLLPAELVAFYKPNIAFIADHAVDPDKRRYAVADEGPRHYIDMDKYKGRVVPREWNKAIQLYREDSLKAHGIVPWWIQVMLSRLTKAFREKNA